MHSICSKIILQLIQIYYSTNQHFPVLSNFFQMTKKGKKLDYKPNSLRVVPNPLKATKQAIFFDLLFVIPQNYLRRTMMSSTVAKNIA